MIAVALGTWAVITAPIITINVQVCRSQPAAQRPNRIDSKAHKPQTSNTTTTFSVSVMWLYMWRDLHFSVIEVCHILHPHQTSAEWKYKWWSIWDVKVESYDAMETVRSSFTSIQDKCYSFMVKTLYSPVVLKLKVLVFAFSANNDNFFLNFFCKF